MTMSEEYSPAQSPTRRRGDDVWPPKYSSVKLLPKTGFSPTIMREGSQGKKFVWPPPKSEHETGSPVPEHKPGHVTHSWLQDGNEDGTKPPPFAPRARPSKRCTDGIWPPPSSNATELGVNPQPRPIKKIGRFEDYIKCRPGSSVPATYRPPPGTQHIEYEETEVIEYTTTNSVETTQQVTGTSLVQQKQQQYLQQQVQSQQVQSQQQQIQQRQQQQEIQQRQMQQQQQRQATQPQQQQQQRQQPPPPPQTQQRRVVVEEEEETEEEEEEEETEEEEEEEEA